MRALDCLTTNPRNPLDIERSLKLSRVKFLDPLDISIKENGSDITDRSVTQYSAQRISDGAQTFGAAVVASAPTGGSVVSPFMDIANNIIIAQAISNVPPERVIESRERIRRATLDSQHKNRTLRSRDTAPPSGFLLLA